MPRASAAVLVARTAMAAKSLDELDRLADRVRSLTGLGHVTFAFTEQGEPSLREVVHRLRGDGVCEVLLLPLLVPLETSYTAFLQRSLDRWQSEAPGTWPTFRIGPGPADVPAIDALLTDLVAAARRAEVPAPPARGTDDGSVVPTQVRRVLVCLGGPCQAAGATFVWGRLRNEAKRLNLRTTGDGTLSARTSCLGPCGLAPVIQVFPEGVYYGGVDEADIDRIIRDHLIEGRIVEPLAYEPSTTRQRLRAKS